MSWGSDHLRAHNDLQSIGPKGRDAGYAERYQANIEAQRRNSVRSMYWMMAGVAGFLGLGISMYFNWLGSIIQFAIEWKYWLLVLLFLGGVMRIASKLRNQIRQNNLYQQAYEQQLGIDKRFGRSGANESK